MNISSASASGMVFDTMAPMRLKNCWFDRHLIWVQQSPMKVIRHLHGETPLEAGAWLASSTLQGISHRSDLGTVTIMREDSTYFDYQPTEIAVRELGINDYKILPSEDFSRLSELYTSGFGNIQMMVDLVREIETTAPELQFFPASLHHLLDQQVYQVLPRAFLRHDMRGHETLVWLGRQPNQQSNASFERVGFDVSKAHHICGGWYAASTSDAIELKLLWANTEIYSLR